MRQAAGEAGPLRQLAGGIAHLRKVASGRMRRLWHSRFIRSVATVASGLAVGQIIMVLATPLLSRLYSPEAYGILGVIVAVSGPAAILATLRYDLAIVLARDEEDAAAVFALSAGCVMVASLALFLFMLFAGSWLADVLGRGERVAELLILVPLVVLVQGLHMSVMGWANRNRDYWTTSAASMSMAGSTVLVQIALGVLKAGAAGGLVVGRICGMSVATLVLGARTAQQDLRLILNSVRLPRIRSLAREHDHFPKYNVPRDVLVDVSGNFPAVFLAVLFDPAAAGLYWFTMRLLGRPGRLIGVAVRRVLYERSATTHRAGGDLLPMLAKATMGLAAIGAVPAVVLILFAPELFEFVFGAAWREAGTYAQWLALWWVSSFCNVAAATVVPVLGLQRQFLGIEIVGLCLRAAAIGVAVLFGDALTAVALYSVVGMMLNIWRTSYVLFHARGRRAVPQPSDQPGG